MTVIEHYVCPQCGCADMRHTAKIEKALYQAEERGIQEGLDLRDDLREQLAGAVEEAAKWKRIAQDRCTCVVTCGDTPEDSGGVCKDLPRSGGQ